MSYRTLIGLHYWRCSVFKNEGNIMLPLNSFDDHSPLADNTESISRLDRIAYLFFVILHKNIHRGIIKS